MTEKENEEEMLKTSPKEHFDQFLLNQSLSRLQMLLNPQPLVDFSFYSNALFEACQLVGNQLQLKFRSPTEKSDPQRSRDEQLHDLCLHSQIYYRKISLPEEWWKNFHSSFVGFNKETQQPIAVLLNGDSGFELHDPSSKEKQKRKIDSKLANEISKDAFVLFRSLPEGKLNLRTFWMFGIWHWRSEWVTFAFLSILCFAVSLCFPIFTNLIFDYIIPSHNIHLLLQITLGASVIVLSTLVFNYNREALLLRLSGLIDHDMEMAIWQRLIQLPATFFRRHSLYDLFLFTNAISSIRQLLSSQGVQVLLNSIFSVLFLILMFYYSVTLAFVGLALLAVELLVIAFSLPFGILYGKELINRQIESNNRTFEVVQALSKIRLSAAEARFFHRWEQAFSDSKITELKMLLLKLRMRTFHGFWSYTSTGIIFLFVILLLNSQNPSDIFTERSITIGGFLAFMTAFNLLSSTLNQVMQTLIKAILIIPLWGKIKEFSSVPPEEYISKMDPGKIQGEVKIKDISFSYQNDLPPVLKDVSMTIPAGRCVALVGPSGCGKSTLIRLLLGFESPQQGSIYYDNMDMTGINLQLLRAQMGTILQSGAILDGTILENVNSGRFYSEQEVIQTFKAMGMSSFIEQLPMGVNTVLTNGGIGLSGGQRQLILLARSLVGTPKILILDEATSSLDSQSQRVIFDNLNRLNMTRIIITQRLDNLKTGVDTIYVMEEGRIVDQGTFDELLHRCSFFSLYTRENHD